MPQSYKGLTLNIQGDIPPTGTRENTNLKAIMDAVLTDSQNPTNITLSQGKTTLRSSSGTTASNLFDFSAPADTPVVIVTAPAGSPSVAHTYLCCG